MAQPRHCRECPHHWSKGVKDGKHNNWCCKFGRPAPKAIGHCKNINGKPNL